MNKITKGTASFVSATAFLLVAGTSTVLAQTTTGEGGCNIAVNSALVDQSDIQSCNTAGSTGTNGVVSAISSLLGISPPPPPADPGGPADPAPTGPIPGSHVGASGAVALSGEVGLPGGTKQSVDASLDADAKVSSPLSVPTLASGFGAGGAVAGAGTVGDADAEASANGNGNSFVETTLADAWADANTGDGISGASGVAGATGVGGSFD